MKKDIRIKVFNKYHAHCAYCGKTIEYEEMQVDHIKPKRQGGTDDIENLNPSCRRCNHYKRANTIEGFRELLKTLHKRIVKDYITKVAIDYGMISIKPFNGKFYFEKIKEKL